MIGKSDLVIIVVSAALLIAAIVRWQQNLDLLETYNNGNTAPATRAPSSTNSRALQPNVATVPANVNQTGSSTQSGNAAPQGSDLSVNRLPANNGSRESAISTGSSSSLGESGITSEAGQPGTSSNELLYGVYVVQSGDYLFKIAQTVGTTVDTLQRINNLPDTVIDVGQQLRYPLPAN